MTDNHGEVVAYADSADERYVTLIRMTPAEDADIPLVPQSLLLAAREELAALEGQYDEAGREWLLALKRAELAAAELAECRRDAESKQAKIDALMLEHCPDEMTEEQLAERERHQALSAIDARVGGEKG